METGNWLSRKGHRDKFPQIVADLRSDAHATIIASDPSWFETGMRLYRSRADKMWSMTDCISFVVMTRHGLQDALSSDHHFQQAGFRALLLQ